MLITAVEKLGIGILEIAEPILAELANKEITKHPEMQAAFKQAASLLVSKVTDLTLRQINKPQLPPPVQTNTPMPTVKHVPVSNQS